MSEQLISGRLPVLALRGLAVFPDQTVHFDVGRAKSIKALEDAMKRDQNIMLVPQRNIVDNDPSLEGLYTIGTVAKVKQVLHAQGENLRVLVTGICRARIQELTQTEPFLAGQIQAVPETEVLDSTRAHAMRREANNLYGLYCELLGQPAQSVQLRMMATEDTGFIADSIAQNSGIDYTDKVKMLCQLNPVKRLEMAVKLLRREVEMVKLESEIQEKTKANIDQNQKDYYLREQIRVLRDELGEGEDESEFTTYEQKILKLNLPKESEQKLLKDLNRLKKQPFGSSEAAVLRNYLDTVLEIPWNVRTKERIDIAAARKILEADHFGLEKVKERILETLAVRKMAPEMPPQIICLVGPPGVPRSSEDLCRCDARPNSGGRDPGGQLQSAASAG